MASNWQVKMPLSAKPRVVISAVNVSEMGPLTVLQDVLTFLSEHYSVEYDIIALVHRRSLFNQPNITYLEFPGIKQSWLRRLKFEYVDSKEISRGLSAALWLSLHDMTPNVIAARQAVYCHNPSPFYPFRLRDFLHDRKFGLFTLLYGYLYGINIKKNSFVIVQQDWIRDEFKRRYGVQNVVVAWPSCQFVSPAPRVKRLPRANGKTRFFYPAYPRVFKNAEVVLEAAAILEHQGVDNFELLLTFDGSENSYAADLVRRYSRLATARFLGLLERAEVFEYYGLSDCLVFPSKLETWGLPISEFKTFRRPLLCADLPYARESVGSYDQVVFFEPDDHANLAGIMRSVIEKKARFECVTERSIAQPFALDWAALFQILLPQATAPETSCEVASQTCAGARNSVL